MTSINTPGLNRLGFNRQGSSQASDVTAIVVSYNSAEVLPACLAALTGAGAHVIVVDNASVDGSVAIAVSAGATVIANVANEGYGRAINIAAKGVTTPFILIVNPDAIVDAPVLNELLAATERYPEVAMFGPALVDLSGEVDFRASSHVVPASQIGPWRSTPPKGDCSVIFILGAVMLVRTDAFRAIGGFDDQIFLYFEDTDFCERLRQAHGHFVYVADAHARHQGGKSSAPSPEGILKRRWHFAWSKAYAYHKFGQPSRALQALMHGAVNLPVAYLSGDHEKFQSHLGYVQGSLAFLRGKRAIDREGLSG